MSIYLFVENSLAESMMPPWFPKEQSFQYWQIFAHPHQHLLCTFFPASACFSCRREVSCPNRPSLTDKDLSHDQCWLPKLQNCSWVCLEHRLYGLKRQRCRLRTPFQPCHCYHSCCYCYCYYYCPAAVLTVQLPLLGGSRDRLLRTLPQSESLQVHPVRGWNQWRVPTF